LVKHELRCKELGKIIARLESAQRRYDSITQSPTSQNGVTTPFGITEAVRNIFDAEPEQVFCTAMVRELLQSRGFDTRQRIFGSAISTVLTRLGKVGFIIITTDGEGNRTYKRKAEMAG
jgi:hypothetical protein